jgi:hypothetical protein
VPKKTSRTNAKTITIAELADYLGQYLVPKVAAGLDEHAGRISALETNAQVARTESMRVNEVLDDVGAVRESLEHGVASLAARLSQVASVQAAQAGMFRTLESSAVNRHSHLLRRIEQLESAVYTRPPTIGERLEDWLHSVRVWFTRER